MRTIVAYFDMDRTILSDSSGMLYIRYLRRRGSTTRQAMLRAHWYAALYKIGLFDYPSVAARLASTASENSEAEAAAFCQRWFNEMGVHYISPKAPDRINDHRAQGHLVVIISASTPYIVGPVAAHLGVSDCLCTQLEVVAQRFTGRIVQPPCYGAGKVYWAERYAEIHNAQLGDAYFYTDSHSDRDLLEKVGHPVAVNPDPGLVMLARRRGWPVEYFH